MWSGSSKCYIQNSLTNKATFAGESGWTWILGGELGSALPATTQLDVWNAYLGNTIGKHCSDIESGNTLGKSCISLPVSFIIGGDKVHDQHVVLHWVQPIQSHLSQSNNFITTTIRFKADWASGPTVHFLGADTWALGPNVPRTPHLHNHHHHHHYEPDRLETCDDRPW